MPFIGNRYQTHSSFLLSFTTFTECPFLGIEEESIDKDSRKVLYLLCNDAVYTLFPSKWQIALFQNFMDIALCLTTYRQMLIFKNQHSLLRIQIHT